MARTFGFDSTGNWIGVGGPKPHSTMTNTAIRQAREGLVKKYRVTVGITMDLDAISDDEAIHFAKHHIHNLIKFDKNHWSPAMTVAGVAYDERGIRQVSIIDTIPTETPTERATP